MYACMHAWMHGSTDGGMDGWMDGFKEFKEYVCTDVRIYVRTCVCMYVCM